MHKYLLSGLFILSLLSLLQQPVPILKSVDVCSEILPATIDIPDDCGTEIPQQAETSPLLDKEINSLSLNH